MRREYYSIGKLLIGINLFALGMFWFGLLIGIRTDNIFMIVFSLMIVIVGEGFILEASSYKVKKQRGDD